MRLARPAASSGHHRPAERLRAMGEARVLGAAVLLLLLLLWWCGGGQCCRRPARSRIGRAGPADPAGRHLRARAHGAPGGLRGSGGGASAPPGSSSSNPSSVRSGRKACALSPPAASHAGSRPLSLRRAQGRRLAAQPGVDLAYSSAACAKRCRLPCRLCC
jgi:hypothetical protein